MQVQWGGPQADCCRRLSPHPHPTPSKQQSREQAGRLTRPASASIASAWCAASGSSESAWAPSRPTSASAQSPAPWKKKLQ